MKNKKEANLFSRQEEKKIDMFFKKADFVILKGGKKKTSKIVELETPKRTRGLGRQAFNYIIIMIQVKNKLTPV